MCPFSYQDYCIKLYSTIQSNSNCSIILPFIKQVIGMEKEQLPYFLKVLELINISWMTISGVGDLDQW